MALRGGHDLVIGSRYLQGVSVVNWPLHRLILSTFANRYIRGVTRMPVADCTSGFRCWRREALAKVPLERIVSDGYAFLVEMLYEAHRSGCSIGEVPIIFVERRVGQSKMSGGVIFESAYMPWRVVLRGDAAGRGDRQARGSADPTERAAPSMRRDRRHGGDVVPAFRGRHPRHLHGADRARPRRPRPRRPRRPALAPEADPPARRRRRHAAPVPLRAASVAERVRLCRRPEGRRRAALDRLGVGAARPRRRHRRGAPPGPRGRRDDRPRPLGGAGRRDGGGRRGRAAARRQPARLGRLRRRAPRRRRHGGAADLRPRPLGHRLQRRPARSRDRPGRRRGAIVGHPLRRRRRRLPARRRGAGPRPGAARRRRRTCRWSSRSAAS